MCKCCCVLDRHARECCSAQFEGIPLFPFHPGIPIRDPESPGVNRTLLESANGPLRGITNTYNFKVKIRLYHIKGLNYI